MTSLSQSVVGVDGCSFGWIATVLDADGIKMEVHEEFEELGKSYSDADRILVDIPIGFPEDQRRRCDDAASELLGCRGLSVFYPPCRSAAELNEYQKANEEHKDCTGNGLSQQAFSISSKMIEVTDSVGEHYDGLVRESHPELCFAALNRQPIAYPKSSERGRKLRMKLLSDELNDAREQYRRVRDRFPLTKINRDDILDSMVLAVTAQEQNLRTVPSDPSLTEPRIYYPMFDVPEPNSQW